MTIIQAKCKIISEYTLEELSSILSKEAFSKVPFKLSKDIAESNVPTMYLERQFMGIAVVLQGASPNYEVRLSTDISIYGNLFQAEVEKSKIEYIHLDRFLYHILSAVFYNDEQTSVVLGENNRNNWIESTP